MLRIRFAAPGTLQLVCAAALLIPANHASAQVNNPAVLSEVVVTAEKRSESVQDVGASVSVVGSELLDNLHATQLTDIGAYVPGLQIDSGGTPGQTSISMRGIAPLSAGATVGTYLDDTPIGSTSIHDRGSAYALDILPYDVQRIEVLEGPQGTLYGADSVGGAIKYILTSPSLTNTEVRIGADVFAVSGAGNPGGGARAMLNAALIPDTLGLIASIASENTPGYIDSSQTGRKDQNAARQQSGRLALLWQPASNLSVRFGGLFQHTIADGNASVALDPVTLQSLSCKLCDNNFLPNIYKGNLQFYSADVNWDLGWGKFVSASSFSNQQTQVDTDVTRTYQPIFALFGAPAGLSIFPLNLTTKKYTQELRLSSASDVPLEWLGGLFYTHEKGTNHQSLTAQNPDGSLIDGLNPFFLGSLPTTYREYAAFGNLTYHITQRFDVSGGLRYARNDQEFQQILDAGPLIATGSNQSGTSSEGVWTYSASPRFHLTPDIMAYARVATGYQAGGPNLAFPGIPPSVKSDRLSNYEVGLKSEFCGHRAIVNVSAYDIEWKDIQVTGSLPGGITYIANGGTARSQGVEADMTVRPADRLLVEATANYTDAKLTQDVPPIGGNSGDRLPFIPKWSGSVRADYTIPLTNDWNGHAGGGLRLVGVRYSSGALALDEFKTGAYGALDLNVDVSNSRYTIRVFAKNVTNRHAYLTDAGIQNGLTGDIVQVEGVVLQPRTVGLSLDARF
jgi:iron complex outermembrane receptor protein